MILWAAGLWPQLNLIMALAGFGSLAFFGILVISLWLEDMPSQEARDHILFGWFLIGAAFGFLLFGIIILAILVVVLLILISIQLVEATKVFR